MNKVFLTGRLTREPEIRVTGSGEQTMCVAGFTLAVERRKGKSGQNEADFISCVAFGKLGEFAENYLHQGTKIAVSGRIRTGSYINERDNKKVYTTDVIVDEIEFCEKKAADGGQKTKADDGSGFMNIPDGVESEGLPFA